ncbi:hypothetical protein INT48_009808 [Thamnidium elegans]|uniref:TOG domain-containing protein n=1 Tax=Thamnidium elegans TaxID=101142 RepID=A0A8H7VZ82_9FUNG|nr:hypothetical protein INT48_009808 [Thamnidium elegans]
MESIPFEIAHCSSSEPDYAPEQLIESSPGNNQDPFQNVSHRGWQTKRFPEYPQDLILRFKSGLCSISKVQILSHHYKIASQIELFIGITKEQEQDSMYIQFTRLGFVSLNNNNRFQDRELKSIKIQADCEYIRLVIKGCHENRLNVHKQVGLLALNILGHAVSLHDNSLVSADQYRHQSISNEIQQRSTIHNTNSDFNLEQWIQVIQNAEEESAQDEDFKEAKIYKELGDRLTGLWRFLINLETDKQQAVESKNYDEADKIKVKKKKKKKDYTQTNIADMIQVRQTAESLLKHSGIQITRDGDILPFDTTVSSSLYNSEDDDDDELAEVIIVIIIKFVLLIFFFRMQFPIYNLLIIPIPSTEKKVEPVIVKEMIDPETIPEPLTEDDIESCELSIEQFGQDIVACIMSVKVKCRQSGLNQLSQLIEQKEDQDLEFIQASLLMIGEAVTDSRESIFNQAIQLWKELHGFKVDKQLESCNSKILGWIQKFFTRVLMRTSDNNPGIKTTATKTVLDLIELYPTVLPLCLKERMIRNMKDAKARIELVLIVTKKVLIPQWKTDANFHRKDMMTFIVSYLKNHPHADVRKSSWDLLVIVSQHQQQGTDFKTICTFLENDTIKLLNQEIKKSEKKKLIKASTSTTVNELRALAVKSNGTKKNTKTQARTEEKKTTAKKKVAKIIEEEEEEEKTNVCIFCDEEDDTFNEDTLISHYYNDCPVLTNCPMCQIILEVSTLKDHLKTDCERKHLVKRCTHCREYVPVEQWLQHTLKKTCAATASNQSRCPFCQKEMSKSTETDWKAHLLTKCTKNPRMPQKK